MSDSQAQAPPSPHSEPDIRAQLRADALTFPAAYEEYPWGQVVIKVNKKVFLFLDGDQSAAGLYSSVKLLISGADVLSLPFTEPTGYGLGKSGWVSESYRAVAPKRLIAQLDQA
jgi:hypothetical protein